MSRRPSLRRRLLAFLALPLLLLLLLDAFLTYYIALNYSNRIHDRNLVDDTVSFAQLLKTMPVTGDLSPQARFLLEYDPDGHRYFNVDSQQHGTVSGNADFSALALAQECSNEAPLLYSGVVNQQKVRLATLCIEPLGHAGDRIAVTVAETFADRRQRAQEILMITVPMQTLLILSIMLLVWFGVNHGLKILDPLTRRLAERRHELLPISSSDVPREIMPLIETIDALFWRLSQMIALQERFVADAAHQLRTPLAGMSLHVDRALADPDPATLQDALTHIHRLNQYAARVSSQLLALTRAQTAEHSQEVVELSERVPEWVANRVPEAIRAKVDLGYQAATTPLSVRGDAAALQEALDNLIDNALRYAGSGSTVTVGLQAHADEVELYIEDNGPGVAESLLPRLGERFFRVPGNQQNGTGLGLAIAHEAVEQHRGRIDYYASGDGGLKVSIWLPRLKPD